MCRMWDGLPGLAGKRCMLRISVLGICDLDRLASIFLQHLGVRDPPGFHTDGAFVSQDGEYVVDEYATADLRHTDASSMWYFIQMMSISHVSYGAAWRLCMDALCVLAAWPE